MKLQHQIDQLLARRASEWHQILENTTDVQQRAAFVAWLKQSPLHLQEYLEIVYTDHMLKHVDAERLEDVDSLLAQVAPTVVPLSAPNSVPVAAKPGGTTLRLGLAAAVAACAVLLTLAYKQFAAPPEFSTAIGEQRMIELADSSLVTLNAASRIEVRLDKRNRDIELLQGEALFKVAHDPARPFRVRTNAVIVQAVGTEFNVHQRPTGTRVSVLEGRVTILPKHDANSGISGSSLSAESLGAGEEALVRPDGAIQRIGKADVMKTVAWRKRWLIFDDTPLEDIVYEFNRLNRTTRLRLDGVPPDSHHYNGIFDASDSESLAELLSREPDLSVERRGGEIVIRQR